MRLLRRVAADALNCCATDDATVIPTMMLEWVYGGDGRDRLFFLQVLGQG